MRQRLLAAAGLLAVAVVVVLLVVGNPFAAATVGPPVATDTAAPTATPTSTPTASETATPTSTPTASETAAAPRTHTPGPGGYDWRTVTLHDADTGARLATVDVRLADTAEKRYTGLSDTDALGADEGMLFVHPAEGNYTYVMRRMAFPLDIVFVSDAGNVTTIHHAPLPSTDDSGDLLPYRGYGRYVLEVPLDYTTEHDVEVGDYIRVHETDLNASAAAPTVGAVATTAD
jgi:hypothetical protein